MKKVNIRISNYLILYTIFIFYDCKFIRSNSLDMVFIDIVLYLRRIVI